MADSSAVVARQRQMQALASRAGEVVQRTLYTNPVHQPEAATLPEFQALDDEVDTAADNARAAVTVAGGAADTPKQINWKVHPNPTTWGYVVEEQLDALAGPLGWNTQTVIFGARPDYSKVVGGATLYADLTTIGQSGVGGPHIGGKLAGAYGQMLATGAAPNWHAADIVHDGAQPGQAAAAIVPNGAVTPDHNYWFGQFKAAVQADDHDPWIFHMTSYYSPHLPHGTFYGMFDTAARDLFVDRARQIDDSSEGSSEFWSDSD